MRELLTCGVIRSYNLCWFCGFLKAGYRKPTRAIKSVLCPCLDKLWRCASQCRVDAGYRLPWHYDNAAQKTIGRPAPQIPACGTPRSSRSWFEPPLPAWQSRCLRTCLHRQAGNAHAVPHRTSTLVASGKILCLVAWQEWKAQNSRHLGFLRHIWLFCLPGQKRLGRGVGGLQVAIKAVPRHCPNERDFETMKRPAGMSRRNLLWASTFSTWTCKIVSCGGLPKASKAEKCPPQESEDPSHSMFHANSKSLSAHPEPFLAVFVSKDLLRDPKLEPRSTSGALHEWTPRSDDRVPCSCCPSGCLSSGRLWRSIFRSQNVQSTPCSDHFWKLRCQKSARRCGAKHISQSKCTKHTMLGPLLEVAMSRKCTSLWREAHFEVKMYKTPHAAPLLEVEMSKKRNQTDYNSTTLQLQLHYTTLHPAVVGEVTDQVTTATIVTTPKKHNSNHISVHQWIRSAIRDSQQATSPIGFLFLKLPPPPCAVLLVYIYIMCVCVCN